MSSGLQTGELKYSGSENSTSPTPPHFVHPFQDRSREMQESASRFQADKFEPEKHEWDYYIAQFETQMHIQNLTGTEAAEIRRNLLLSHLGSNAFKVLYDRFSPDQPYTKSYDELKSALQNHYGKKTCVMAERKEFQLRMRKKGESITDYLTALRKIGARCRFGQSQTERLRDQLVIGINNPDWQQELLRQFPSEEATLQQVETAASILEQATVQQHRMQAMSVKEEPDKATAKKPTGRGGPRRQVSVGITNVTVQQQQSPIPAPIPVQGPGQYFAPSMYMPPPTYQPTSGVVINSPCMECAAASHQGPCRHGPLYVMGFRGKRGRGRRGTGPNH